MMNCEHELQAIALQMHQLYLYRRTLGIIMSTYLLLINLYLLKYKWHTISKRWVQSHAWLGLLWIHGDEEHGNSRFKFLYSITPSLTYFSNRSNNEKINESIKYDENMFIIDKNGFWLRIIVSKINALSGWGIETFYLVTKKKQFGIINNSFNWCGHDRNWKFNINYRNIFIYDIKTHTYWSFCSWNICGIHLYIHILITIHLHILIYKWIVSYDICRSGTFIYMVWTWEISNDDGYSSLIKS